ncbi:murein hydrolase activator EnvC family protein [Streptomyces chumphonensis]|uniref:murein hydrolase activator EnvC family protein n=1 Tax=Streptomyces chumphonensis TaxID=1214925 RepID=UPI003D711E62
MRRPSRSVPLTPPPLLLSLLILLLPSAGSAWGASVGSAVSVGSPAARGTPVWPVGPDTDVVRDFAPPPERWQPGHRGVDLAGRVGQQVRAAVDGEVVFAGEVAGRGVVSVELPGAPGPAPRTTYEPLRPSVARGDRVRAGQVIGTLLGRPSHCAPRVCLHWGLLRGRSYENPLSLLGAGRPVLLPLSGVPVPTPRARGAVDLRRTADRRRAADADGRSGTHGTGLGTAALLTGAALWASRRLRTRAEGGGPAGTPVGSAERRGGGRGTGLRKDRRRRAGPW